MAPKKKDTANGNPLAFRITVEYRALTWFKPYETNPKKHEVAEVQQFAEAIRTFGFLIPVLARSDGELVDGHFRLDVAKMLGLTEVPVILVDHLSPAKIRALRLSIGRMAELQRWDADLVQTELEQVEQEGEVPLDADGAIGFELADIDEGIEAKEWDFSPTRDVHVVTITSPLPIADEIRERLRGLQGVSIEASTLQRT